ncbi:hypothetical protein EYF80_057296 [Liparis tanakae]|uniref:Uncharacterized protein n=1 Tax=Liparis tanakae TaxID=230148 RepID=A0A4Z2EUL8_9TELE|nr:hypothetical protein EYF80_057296 [Liparis tanakae]
MMTYRTSTPVIYTSRDQTTITKDKKDDLHDEADGHLQAALCVCPCVTAPPALRRPPLPRGPCGPPGRGQNKSLFVGQKEALCAPPGSQRSAAQELMISARGDQGTPLLLQEAQAAPRGAYALI